MTRNEPETSMDLDLSPPNEAANHAGDEWMPMGEVRVLVPADDEERSYSDCSHLGFVLVDLLESIESVLDGEECLIEFDRTALRVTPLPDRDAVRLYLEIEGVDDELRNDKPALVDRGTYVTEVYQSVHSWYEEAARRNPDLVDLKWLSEIADALDNTSEILQKEPGLNGGEGGSGETN